MWYSLNNSLGCINLKGCKAISSGTSVMDRTNKNYCDVIVYYEVEVPRSDLEEADAPKFLPFDYSIPVRVSRDLKVELDAKYRCEILEEATSSRAKVRCWVDLVPGQSKSDFAPDLGYTNVR